MYRKYTGENIITKYQLKWSKVCIQEPVVFTALKIFLNSFFPMKKNMTVQQAAVPHKSRFMVLDSPAHSTWSLGF